MKEKIVKLSVLFLVIFVLQYFLPKDVMQVNAGENINVVDGDSLEIDGKRIRLLGIDSPEYHQFCYDAKHRKYNCGIEAKEYLKSLVASHNVKCEEESRDIYNRSLCVCYADGKNINEEMVKAGWALSYREEGEKYLSLEKQAKSAKRGIWRGRFMRPDLYRFLNKRKNS